MKTTRSRGRLLSCSALASLLALTAPAYAAAPATSAPAPAAANKSDSSTVDEIVVTGGLRAQRLQDAPMAVTAVAAEEFTDAGFKSPSDLQFLSPSVQVSVQGPTPSIFVAPAPTARWPAPNSRWAWSSTG
jgi:iron complex outermembrane receptor protein